MRESWETFQTGGAQLLWQQQSECDTVWLSLRQVVSVDEGRVRVETEKTVSSFVIEGAVRDDEGTYTISVTNPAGEDTADLFVKVVGQWLFVDCAFSSVNLQTVYCVFVSKIFHEPLNASRLSLKVQ